MPLPPRHAIKTTCKHCGWSTVTHQASDVIMRPSRCARCGTDDLTHAAANAFETAAAALLWKLKRGRARPAEPEVSRFLGRRRE